MSAHGPTASWHPAMMPNSEADRLANLQTIEPPAPSEPSAEPTETAPVEPKAIPPFKPIDTSETHSSSVDDWFPDYEAGSPWKPQEEVQDPIQVHVDEAQQLEHAPAAEPDVHLAPEPVPQQDEQKSTESQAIEEPQPEEAAHLEVDQVPEHESTESRAVEEPQQEEAAYLEVDQAPEQESTESQAVQEPQQEEVAHLEADQVPEPEAHQDEEAPAQAVEAAPAPEDTQSSQELQEQPAAPSSSKHVSSDSFARTVSHQPNFMDDDDPEWDLPRAETDLFKFMPPNERTNSFPVVPQLAHQDQEQVEPLPTNQAEDIINAIEHQSESFEFEDRTAPQGSAALQQDSFWGNDGDDAEAGFPAQIGGDLQVAEEEASDARYAEGLPLIDHQKAEREEVQGETKVHDPFAEDAEGDDFFAQIGGDAGAAEQQNIAPGQLERKSTMQVLNGLSVDGTAGTGGLLESTLEEEELLDESPAAEPEAELQAEENPATADETTNLEPVGEKSEDLAAKWSEAFADDDDDQFLLDDEPVAENNGGAELDPSAFLVDDDDGFLEDVDEPAPQPAQPPTTSSQAIPPQPAGSNRYLPTAPAQPTVTHAPNSYFPSASPMISQAQNLAPVPSAAASPYIAQSAQQMASTPYGAPPPRPAAVNKAQSYADKAKGGYSSPYDLPMEVVKPRKRASYQQMPREAASAPPPGPPMPPPRSASMGPPAVQGPPGIVPPPQGPLPVQRSASSMSPPVSNHSVPPPSLMRPPPQLSSKSSGFFEDLPSSNKTRPASRTSSKGQPSPQHATFNGPPQSSQPPPFIPTPPQEKSTTDSSLNPDIPRLVPPAPTNPYAALPAAAGSASSVMPPAAARYSPVSTPGSAPGSAVPPPNRYSPAPPAQRAAGYGPNTTATPPTVLPHLPRTSSPLAHFEARPAAGQNEPPLHPSRSTSSLYEPRLHRMPSLPPTREVEDEDNATQASTGVPPPSASQLPPRGRHNAPPPLDSYSAGSMSPPKRKISYGGTTGATDIVPPPRSQTGSPGAMYGLRSPIKASEISPRPSSAQGPAPVSIASAINPVPAPAASTRPRALSQKFNLIPPTDGREHDPLQRWKGVPLISWGVGGTLITSFPVEIPRYGMNQPGPMIVRSPGEIKVKTIKEVQPLEERLAKFPGPLRGKSKKKDTVSWLSAGIEELEKGLPNLAFQTQPSHEDKRAVERVLLWKVLRVMIENDGILEGNATVDKSVRDVLSLAPAAADEVTTQVFADGGVIGGFAGESSSTQMQADSVDSGTVQQLKKSLLAGDREKAVWAAADKRLWGHALLIANTVSPDLYHKVSQEFIKKEVNFPGHNNESLAALYSVLSGNHEESVDELVPVHARAGLQLIASSTGPVANSTLEGLEKWRETLTLILSNRSTGDAQALNSMGNLLSGYGRAEAAHICFLFARSATVFGGLDDPRSQFVLVGADHRTQSQQFFKETEALLLSEVYEYGLSLTGSPSVASGVPHLSVYKLQHAITLAEHGFRDKALQYCDIILKDMGAQTKRSPYHHIILESAVEDLRQRMLQAPSKEASGSWISKPSMGKVSDSVWSRFNKFVAGDEDAPGHGSPKFGEESGPFAGLAGGTPTVSRPPSASNATAMEMFSSPNGYTPGAPPLAANTSPVLTRSASRYAPAAAQASAATSPYEPNAGYTPSGRSSMERTSGEYSRSPYEPRQSSEVPASSRGGYVPSNVPAPAQSYPPSALGITQQSPYQPAPPSVSTTVSAVPPGQSSDPKTPSFSPYAPFSQTSSPYAPVTNIASPYAPSAPTENDKPSSGDGQGYGFEPPSMTPAEDEPAQAIQEPASSGGYEPPSYQPYGYEPPSYEPDVQTHNGTAGNGDEAKPRMKSFMDDDADDFPSMTASKAAEKSKAEKDRENEELFRKAAEEDAKRAEEEKAKKGKKGWGLGSWFGGGGGGAASKKESLENSPNKPIRAKLGEKSSFVYDPEQKRWVNKAAGAEDQPLKSATPPPPRSMSRAATGTSPPPGGPAGSAPPPRTATTPAPSEGAGTPPMGGSPGSAPPPMLRAVSTPTNGIPGGPASAPPSRPATSMSNASSIDDLLGAAAPRKGGARGKKKGGRYVDVMAK